jgi:hypothetical protein
MAAILLQTGYSPHCKKLVIWAHSRRSLRLQKIMPNQWLLWAYFVEKLLLI